MSKFYITTTLPYVNAEPHIGFAQEIIAADVIARHQRMLGKQVVFNTGTDEHGQKIYEKAVENNQPVQEYVDHFAAQFSQLKETLDLSYTHFIRTTDQKHVFAAQQFWLRCKEKGDIYKKNYQAVYCVGCELEKQASELVDGNCPLHPNKPLEVREEENYFFKFSAYQEALLNLYEAAPEFVSPKSKMTEIAAFVEGGLQDFSVSRLRSKMPWGVPVPDDEEHVMYVWFDALVSYISTLDWPTDSKGFSEIWPGMQVAGKDNLRQQSAMWQAMLMSANLPNSQKILINGFISVDGSKMSKSLGNVISPNEMVQKYGQQATRFLLMYLGPFGSDMDVTWQKLDTIYTAHLSNGVGNACSRVARMCANLDIELSSNFQEVTPSPEWTQLLAKEHAIKEALDQTVGLVQELDQFLAKEQPWKLPSQEQRPILISAINQIMSIAKQLEPYMPQVAATITNHFNQPKIAGIEPLFPRIS